MVNLYSYLGFCDNNMCIIGPNSMFWLREATVMDGNGGGMLNDGSFAPFWTTGDVMHLQSNFRHRK